MKQKSWGARGIARVSRNPRCQVQAAMVYLGMPEEEFYERYVGLPFTGERGERTAALVWGRRFEANLESQNATALVAALSAQVTINPATAIVRDLRKEVPGDTPADIAERRQRTTQVLAAAAGGRPSCDLLLQAPLRLPLGLGRYLIVVPDALVLDRAHGGYLTVEIKGFVTVDGVAEPGDRDGTRRQAAVQIRALQAECARLGVINHAASAALLVLATPFGLSPHPAVREELDAECKAVDRAMRTYAQTASQLEQWRQQNVPPEEAVRRLPVHFQESCVTSCAMAGACRLRAPGLTGPLGDGAGRSFGPSVDLPRVVELLSGATASTPEESDLLAVLRATSARFGWGWT